jgi:hypothetical protein
MIFDDVIQDMLLKIRILEKPGKIMEIYHD